MCCPPIITGNVYPDRQCSCKVQLQFQISPSFHLTPELPEWSEWYHRLTIHIYWETVLKQARLFRKCRYKELFLKACDVDVLIKNMHTDTGKHNTAC